MSEKRIKTGWGNIYRNTTKVQASGWLGGWVGLISMPAVDWHLSASIAKGHAVNCYTALPSEARHSLCMHPIEQSGLGTSRAPRGDSQQKKREESIFRLWDYFGHGLCLESLMWWGLRSTAVESLGYDITSGWFFIHLLSCLCHWVYWSLGF